MNSDILQKAVDLIKRAGKVIVTTHTRPDGDACGCVVAIAEMLKAIGKDEKIILASELPEWYEFLFPEKPAVLDKDFNIEQLKDGSFFQPDLIIIADTNSRKQLEGLADFIEQNKTLVLVFDHHLTSDSLGNVELIDTKAAATGLIIYDLFKYAGWEITENIALALFVAIATDTGWFRFASTDSRVHKATAELIEYGVNSAELFHKMYQSFSLPRFKLMTTMLNTLQLHFDGRYAEQHLLLKDFEDTGAAYKDTENLIDECQKIKTVVVCALFVEQKDGKVKCSLRSRGGVDVREVAQKFGGGGHKEASGVHLQGTLDDAKKSIKTEIEKQLK